MIPFLSLSLFLFDFFTFFACLDAMLVSCFPLVFHNHRIINFDLTNQKTQQKTTTKNRN